MNQILEILAQFNLSDKESAIYMAALEVGPSSAQAIARQANIQRTYFYDLIGNLIHQGLIEEFIEGKHKYYSACDPQKLVTIQTERLNKIKEALPQLKAIYNTLGKKAKVYYFDGPSGIEQINHDTLNYRGEFYAFTTPRFIKHNKKESSIRYIKDRVKRGISVKVIGEECPTIRELKERDWKELRETKILPFEEYHSDVEIGIYGSKIFVVDYKKQSGLIIESAEIASVMKLIFKLVWNSK